VKKLFISGLLVICLCICLIGCDQATPTNTASETPSSTVAEDTNSSAKDGEGAVGKAYVKILSATKSKDHEGKPAVVVTYEYTNNDDEAQSFILAVGHKVFQGGVECKLGIMIEGYDAKTTLTEVKKGATIEVTCGYVLQNDIGDIEVELNEFLSLSKTPSITKTFSIK